MPSFTVGRSAPVGANQGDQWYFSDTGTWKTWNGASWQDPSVLSIQQGPGSLSVAASGIITAIVPNATANAWVVQDVSGNQYWATDTRTNQTSINAHFLDCADMSVVSQANMSIHQIANATFNLTLTGATTVDALNGIGGVIQPPNIISASATVTKGSTFVINGAPSLSGGAGLTDAIALHVTGGGNVGVLIETVMTTQPANTYAGLSVSHTFPADTTNSAVQLFGIKVFTSFAAGTYTANRGGDLHVIQSTLPANVTLSNTWVHVGHDPMTINGTITTNGIIGFWTQGPIMGATGSSPSSIGIGIQAPTNSSGGTLSAIYGIKFDTTNPWTTLIGGVRATAIQTNGGDHAFIVTMGTITAAANAAWNGFLIDTSTFALTGATAVSGAAGIDMVRIKAPTVNSTTAGLVITNASTVLIDGPPAPGGANPPTITNAYALKIASGNFGLGGLVTLYNNVATAGYGASAIRASGRPAQQTNTTTVITSYANPATDASYEVRVNVNVTTSTTVTMTVTCTYTDEANVARTLTIPFFILAGTLVTSITTAQGNIAYESVPLTIRVKASTTISLQTAGTVTAVVYTCEGRIVQVA